MSDYQRTGKVLTRPAKSVIKDLEREELDPHRLIPHECLMDSLTELAEYIVGNKQKLYHGTNFESFETRFGKLIMHLSEKGFNIDPYVQLHESLFKGLRKKMREESLEKEIPEMYGLNEESGISGRYNLKSRDGKLRKASLAEFQAKRVRGIYRILRKIYQECGRRVVDESGEIVNPRFREVWDNFQYDIDYLEKQDQDVSRYPRTLEEFKSAMSFSPLSTANFLMETEEGILR